MELRKVFARASQRAPCVVIIDDIESLCPQRGGSASVASDVQLRMTSSLLSILDGAEPLKGVFLIATSASPSRIDAAMRRPGRLEKEFELGVPDPVEREDILRNILQGMGVSIKQEQLKYGVTYVGLKEAGGKTHGMVASDLVLVCKEALVHSSLTAKSDGSSYACGAEAITDEALLKAVDRVVPSAIREVAVDVPCVKWGDIGGMEEVKRSLREVRL